MPRFRMLPPAKPVERPEHFDEKRQVPFRPPNANGDAFPIRVLDYPDAILAFVHHRDRMKEIYEHIKRLALMAPPVLTQAMVPEGRSLAMAKTNEELFATRTGRTQSKEPNVQNLPRSEDGKVKGVAGTVIAEDEMVNIAESYRRVRELENIRYPVYRAEFNQQPSHVTLEAGKDLPIYNQMGRKLADARLEGCGRLVVYGKENDCAVLAKGDEADLFNEEGTGRMGRVIYDGCGVFRIKEDPTDIKIGREMWAVVDRAKDPTVCFGKVRRIETSMEEGFDTPRIRVQVVLENGHHAWAEARDVYPDEDEARNRCVLYRSMLTLGYDVEKLANHGCNYAPPGVFVGQEEK